MTVLARQNLDHLGRISIETFWGGGGYGMGVMNKPGPIIFVSALDAEICRQIVNNQLKPNEKEWIRVDLNAIDLPQMIEILKGRVTVHIFEAFVATDFNTLVAGNEDFPRMRLIPHCFSFQESDYIRGESYAFQFSDSIFKTLREDWLDITKDEYARSLSVINSKPAKELAQLAKQAIKAIKITPLAQVNSDVLGSSAIFSPPSRKWRFGTDAANMPKNIN